MIFININDAINDFNEPRVFESYEKAALESSSGAGIFPVLDFKEEDLVHYKDAPRLGVIVQSVRDFLFLAKTKVPFAFCGMDLAPVLQHLAQEYLLDIKVIAIIAQSDLPQDATSKDNALRQKIEKIATHSIDGVVLLNW